MKVHKKWWADHRFSCNVVLITRAILTAVININFKITKAKCKDIKVLEKCYT